MFDSLNNPASKPLYYVDINGRRRGPFARELIEAMILSGHFPKNPLVCREGTSDWTPLVFPKTTVVNTPATRKRGNGRSTLHFGIAVAIGIAVIAGCFSLHNSQKEKPSKRETQTSRSPTPSREKRTSSKSSSYSKPVSVPPESFIATPPILVSQTSAAEPTFSITNKFGKTYRVSRSDFERLNQWEKKLDAPAAAIELARSRLHAMGAQLDAANSTLNLYNQWEVDNYNAKVNIYNTQRDEFNARVRLHNLEVDRYNTELARVGVPSF